MVLRSCNRKFAEGSLSRAGNFQKPTRNAQRGSVCKSSVFPKTYTLRGSWGDALSLLIFRLLLAGPTFTGAGLETSRETSLFDEKCIFDGSDLARRGSHCGEGSRGGVVLSDEATTLGQRSSKRKKLSACDSFA